MNEKLNIFVSSVQKELEDERVIVQNLLSTDPFLSAHCSPILYEFEPASPDKALEGCLKSLDGCHVYLLIVAAQYGTLVGKLSITHAEYRRSKERKLPVLAFIKGDRKVKREDGTEALLKELDDAKLIQSSFLPEPHHDFGAVEISGHYEPASECSGDCWYYCENQNKIFFFVGDVTGHGVAAALITSSIRSAFSVIESNVEMTTQNIIRIVNKAVYETYKGKVTMTFFVSSIDKGSGEVSYCNASHEPPFILKKGEGVPSKKDLVFLNITKNPPIGRSPDSHFNVSQINLEPGDLIFAHTDGLFDLKDPRGISWGERNAYNGILKSVAQSWSPKQIVGDLNSLVQEFRNETPLIDDVTFLVCAFKGE